MLNLLRIMTLVLCALIVQIPSVFEPLEASAKNKIPRFVTLRANEVNMRAGPGVHYPVEWVFKQKGLPLKVIAEFHHWRKVEDFQGTVGWIHKSLLSGRQKLLIRHATQAVYHKKSYESDVVGYLKPLVIASIDECEKLWCYIHIDKVSGWVPVSENVWGTLN